MMRIDLRRTKSKKHNSQFTPKVTSVLALEELQIKFCRTIPGPPGIYEVIERALSFRVSLRERTCKCRRWDLTGIPCRHALRVIRDKKFKVEDYVAHWYLTSFWQKQYEDSIYPLNHINFWKRSGEPDLQAPPRQVSRGRDKNPQKRMKSVHESPTKGKTVSHHRRVMHCSRCGFPGHTAPTCGNPGAPIQPRKGGRSRGPNEDLGEEAWFDVRDAPPSTQD